MSCSGRYDVRFKLLECFISSWWPDSQLRRERWSQPQLDPGCVTRRADLSPLKLRTRLSSRPRLIAASDRKQLKNRKPTLHSNSSSRCVRKSEPPSSPLRARAAETMVTNRPDTDVWSGFAVRQGAGSRGAESEDNGEAEGEVT